VVSDCIFNPFQPFVFSIELVHINFCLSTFSETWTSNISCAGKCD